MPTPTSLSARKDEPIIPTKIRLTGNQMVMRSRFRGCRVLIRPRISHALTRTTARAHWKKSRAIGAWKEKLASACLFSMTMEPLPLEVMRSKEV